MHRASVRTQGRRNGVSRWSSNPAGYRSHAAPAATGIVVRVSHRACCAVAVLSACFHPEYDRPRCDSRGECPGHLACIDQVCEEPDAVSLELALPDGPLAPAGVTSADVVVHGSAGDTMRTAPAAGGALD